MPHPKFLEQIADFYTSSRKIEDIANTTFIFPNNRSAIFLKNYITQRMPENFTLMPRFTTFSRFTAFTSKLHEAPRFELLFMLYKAYVKELEKIIPKVAESAQFDKFVFWGDMILDDFDLIDSSLADASKIYANLKGIKEITADYLSPEQKEVIEEMWGKTNLTQHIEGFWFHTESGKKTEMAKEFIALWEILGPLYTEFRKNLNDARLATPGMQVRKAVSIIKDTSIEKLAKRKYAFVGHADLSYGELAIMKRLKDASCADFFWDLGSPLFYHKGKPDTTNLAIKFISHMAKKFPMPDDFELKPIEKIGKIDIIGVSSSVMQTKIAAEIISKLNLDEKKAMDTAIVVPTPTQLMPLMLSLPKLEHGINVTLGLPYTSTTFATLFSAIIAMQRKSSKSSTRGRTFFFQDVLEVLIHPHIQFVASTEANLIRQYIYDRKLYNIEAKLIIEHFPSLAFIFNPINDNGGSDYMGDIDSSCSYIENLIKGLKNTLSVKKGYEKSFEMEILNFFEEEVAKLKDYIVRYSISMKESTFLTLFERIMLKKTIKMEGTPLKGLQVMGVLETRNLDFDRIIFMAMNERSLPRREYVRTMIPNSLRHGYGLPTIEHTESFYSYYFFRAISRASHATLLYDSRPPAKGRGEISRYLEQLLYVFNDGSITHNVVSLAGTAAEKREITVEKTNEVMKRLDLFKTPGSKHNISASSLKTYLNCPLEFYLKCVIKLGEDDEPTDFIDAAELGDIFHKAAKIIYDNHRDPIKITAGEIQKILDSDEIDNAILSVIAQKYNLQAPPATDFESLNSEARLIFNQIKMEMRQMLEVEKDTECADGQSFIYECGEKDVIGQWTVGKHTFNFRMQIDRIDRVEPSMLRFIDYKTGLDELSAGDSIEGLFEGNSKKNAIFQLLTYSTAYEDMVSNKDDITYKLYTLRTLMKDGKLEPLKFKRQPMPPFSAMRPLFYPHLVNLIDKIFDDTTPFAQCADVNRCKYCPFTSVCGRIAPVDKFN